MINLDLIRAAIEANTGVQLTNERVKQLLVEEGIITPRQARDDTEEFRGYGEFFDYDEASVETEILLDDREGLPE